MRGTVLEDTRTRYADQENVTHPAKGLNTHKTGRPVRQPGRLKRIPLGGKDSNSAVPTLSRSSTTIDVGTRPKVSLVRSNSSLGLTAPKKPEPTALQASQNTIFNPSAANRPPELLALADTDSLRKRILHIEGPPLAGQLPSTFSARTEELSSSNVVSRRILGDPVKSPVRKTHSRKNSLLIEKLSHEGIEYAPEAENIEYVPVDAEPLTGDMLSALSRKRRQRKQHEVVFGEIDLDNIDFDDSDDGNDNELGMNEQDLNELLDF